MVNTKSALKKVIKKGQVFINGEKANTGTLIRGGEQIELEIPEAPSIDKAPDLKLEVLFEDDYLAIINKQAGVLVSGNKFLTIAKALSFNLKPSSQKDAVLPQPIHRLDYATSGVLLIGKTSSSIQQLGILFSARNISKSYYAVCIGPLDHEGEINSDIDNKPSSSTFELIETVDSERFGKLNLVKLIPKTGRRHQLRKHLSSIGNPILGDKEYGESGKIHFGKGLYLHAYSLSFIHPVYSTAIEIYKGLPKKFLKIFADPI
ncbi:MAG: 23S rRNA pseudouridine1911/1915/1917 synthase [Sphingobacteriales bacterium]|jgi:23S rRNA pseudouridine1911/1915/1917 synthase